jgi:biotin carboxyl carrier protein
VVRKQPSAQRPAGSASAADPERLDILVPYAPSRAWAAVLALVLVAGTALAWSWFARVNTQVRLTGVLVAGSGPTVVPAPVTGTVSRLLVVPGTAVTAGMAVADVLDAAGNSVAVRAPTQGTVSSVLAMPGKLLAAGTPLVALDHTGATLNAALFADPTAGLQLSDGQVASVAFFGGVVSGVVTAVGSYLAGPDDLTRIFGTSAVPGAPDAPFRLIFVRLAGVRAFPGATLTPVTVSVIVARQRPLDAILPGGQP